MVAKSYAAWPTASDPFTIGNKTYIKLRDPKGQIKQVRYYTEAEYAKFYAPTPVQSSSDLVQTKSDREIFGFDCGYIYIFRGPVEEHEDFFSSSPCRYATPWGWYLCSLDESFLDSVPSTLTPVKLPWSQVSSNDKLLPLDQLNVKISTFQNAEFSSNFVGTPGQRLEIQVTVESVRTITNDFGSSKLYTFKDQCGNTLTWSTSSSTKTTFLPSTTYSIRATIKQHEVYNGRRITSILRPSIRS